MLRSLIDKFLFHRHYWRHVGFSELSEIYASTLLRTMAMSVIGVFLPIYLYKIGYTISEILFFFAVLIGIRCFMNLAAGLTIARVGPKHAIGCSYILQIVGLLLLLSLPSQQWPLWLVAIPWSASIAFYFNAYHVDLSKIKHSDHVGKELGYTIIMQRIGGVLGPVSGGLVATFFGAQYTIGLAICLFGLSLVPLFLSAEVVRIHQHLNFKDKELFKTLRRDGLSYGALSVENHTSMVLWPFFIGVVIFTANTYALVGLLTSLSLVVSLTASYMIGKLVDKRKGGLLLRYSVIINALLHLSRPLANGFGSVLAINVGNEVVTEGYRMPYHKGLYDAADSLPGRRIVYIVGMEVIGDIVKTAFWLLLWVLSLNLAPTRALQLGFVIAAVFSLSILSQRFPALKGNQ